MYKKILRYMNLMAALILVLTSVIVLIVCYRTIDTRFRDEIKSETELLGACITVDENAAANGLKDLSSDVRVTLISPEGTVLSDNGADANEIGNHADRPEIIDAEKNGTGFAKRYSSTLKAYVYYYAQKLPDENILRCSKPIKNLFAIFTNAALIIFAAAVLIYILCLRLSRHITRSIVAPIEKINPSSDDFEGIYEELIPFAGKIKGQTREINRQLEEIKHQRIRLETISENMNEGLLVSDEKGKIIAANESIIRIFGKNREFVLNHDFVYITRDEQLLKNFRTALAGQKSDTGAEINNRTYRAFFSPVFENGIKTGVIMLMFDISEAAEAEKIRREFSANVSHELKTPLTTISGYSQLISSDIAKPEDVKQFTIKIEKESARLLALIDDIIKLSRLDEGEQGEKEHINLKEISGSVAESLSEKAAKRNIGISVDGSDAFIDADKNEISELVFNLADNAVKYNKDGGKVRISVKNGSITVSDTGIGIPSEYQNRIFERFFRVDKSRSKKTGGTGLGLSIVKHIAIKNNAVITVESETDKGTSITVKFR